MALLKGQAISIGYIQGNHKKVHLITGMTEAEMTNITFVCESGNVKLQGGINDAAIIYPSFEFF